MFHFFALVIPNSCSLTLKSSAVKALRLRFDFCPLWPVDTPASVFEFWNLNPQGEMVVEDSFVTVQFREDQERGHHSSMYLLHGKRAKQQQKAAWMECSVQPSTVRSLSLFKKKRRRKKQIPICLSPHLVEGNGHVWIVDPSQPSIRSATAGKRPRVEERAGPHLVWVRGQKGERITGEVSGRGFIWIWISLFFFWTDWGRTRRVWFGISGCAFVQISKSSKRTLRARQTDNVGGPPACRRGRDAVCSVTVCSCVRSELVNGVWKNRIVCLCLHLHIFFLSLDFVGNDLIASLKIEGKSYVVNETKC